MSTLMLRINYLNCFLFCSAGFFILVGYGADLLLKSFPQRKNMLVFLFASFLVVMATKTMSQNRVWRSRETLFV